VLAQIVLHKTEFSAVVSLAVFDIRVCCNGFLLFFFLCTVGVFIMLRERQFENFMNS